MNLLHPPTLKALCARGGLRPSKAAGQNFLIHGGTLAAIVDAVAPQPSETIVEVGAGFGVLTRALAEQLQNGEPMRTMRNGERKNGEPEQATSRIIAIERDKRIAPILREQVTQYPWVEVVEGDVLRLFEFILNPANAGRRISHHQASPQIHRGVVRCCEMLRRSASQHKLKIVANLPYSITSDFLRLLFDAVGTGALPPPERVVLLLQHEVVERLLGRTPGDIGLLTMIARLHCARIHRIAKVPASHFWPAPKVASAVVVMDGWRTPEEIAEMVGGRSGELQLAMSGRPTEDGGLTPDGDLNGSPLRVRARGSERGRREAQEVRRYTFLSLLTCAFSHPRRQIQNNLDLPPTAWAAAGVAPTARPATLTLEQWIALARVTISPSTMRRGREGGRGGN